MATPMDGNQVPDETGTEQPASTPVSKENGQLSRDDILAIIEAQNEQFRKSMQKGVDKQVGHVRDDVKRILELRENGLDATQIERELWIDQQMHSAPADPGSGIPEKGTSLDVDAFVKSIGLDGNDVRVATYKQVYGSDPKLLVEKLESLASPGKQNSAASAPLPEHSGPAPVSNIEALSNQYIEKYQAALKNGDRVAASNIRSEYRKKGVNVDAVKWSVS